MYEIAILSFILGYVVVLLLGGMECAQGTWLERMHYALSDGMCDLLEYVVVVCVVLHTL